MIKGVNEAKKVLSDRLPYESFSFGKSERKRRVTRYINKKRKK
jgi:hypothetical protein